MRHPRGDDVFCGGNVDRVKTGAIPGQCLEEDDNSGTNEASGDSILVAFARARPHC